MSLGRATLKSRFSLQFHAQNVKMLFFLITFWRKYRFWWQKCIKKNENNFEIFRPELYIEFVLVFLSKWVWVELCWKVYFPDNFVYKMWKCYFLSLLFCENTVFGYKKGSKINLKLFLKFFSCERSFSYDFILKNFKKNDFKAFFTNAFLDFFLITNFIAG